MLLMFDQMHIGRYSETSNNHRLCSTNALLTLMESHTHKCHVLLVFDQMHCGRYAEMSNDCGLYGTDTSLTLMDSNNHKCHVSLVVKILS